MWVCWTVGKYAFSDFWVVHWTMGKPIFSPLDFLDSSEPVRLHNQCLGIVMNKNRLDISSET